MRSKRKSIQPRQSKTSAKMVPQVVPLGYKRTEVGVIPEDWEVKRLGDIGDISGSGVDKKIRPGETPVLLLNYLDVYRKDFIHAKDLTQEVSAKPEQATRCEIRKGDVFFTPTSEVPDDIAQSAVAVEDVPDGVYSYHLVRLRLKEPWDLRFRAYVFKTKAFFDTAYRYAEGSGTRYVITLPQFRSMCVGVPQSIAEQHAIAQILSDMDAEIDALERRREKAKQIKQGMMQQLLTGRIRLVKPQTSAPRTDEQLRETKGHSWAFNEAIVISVLAKHFGSERHPLGRKRYTKLSYLLHRYADKNVEGYLKKAAGPYNPKTKYGGPEKIALEKGYVRKHKRGAYSGFVAADNIAEAEGYFNKWYGLENLQWLEQFRFKKNDELELLTTVDMAVEELRADGKDVDVKGVKGVIRSHPEWKAKLDRPVFSDTNIARAIKMLQKLLEASEE